MADPETAPYIALVTGASSGIGEASARRLADRPGTQLVLVARREDRLNRLAAELGGAMVIAEDLTDSGAPERIREAVDRVYGRLDLLVNNAGGAWRGTFADGGWESIERHLRLNFEAPVRLTEALLPLLRRTASAGGKPAIVNVASTAARVARPHTGAYSASKSALAGWSDALRGEEKRYGVHVGLVLPGFAATEGFPAAELLARRATRWMVCSADHVAEAILDAGPGGKPERYVPRPYWLAAAARLLLPGLVRRVIEGGLFTTQTGGDYARS